MTETTFLYAIIAVAILSTVVLSIPFGKPAAGAEAAPPKRTGGWKLPVRVVLLLSTFAAGVYLYYPHPAVVAQQLVASGEKLKKLTNDMNDGKVTPELQQQAAMLCKELENLAGKATFSSKLRGGPNVETFADGLAMTASRLSETVVLEGAQVETDGNLIWLQCKRLADALKPAAAAKSDSAQ